MKKYHLKYDKNPSKSLENNWLIGPAMEEKIKKLTEIGKRAEEIKKDLRTFKEYHESIAEHNQLLRSKILNVIQKIDQVQEQYSKD